MGLQMSWVYFDPCFWCVEIALVTVPNIVEDEIFGTMGDIIFGILYCSNTKKSVRIRCYFCWCGNSWNDKHVATIIFASLCMNSMKVHIRNWTRIHPPRIRTAYLRSHPAYVPLKKSLPVLDDAPLLRPRCLTSDSVLRYFIQKWAVKHVILLMDKILHHQGWWWSHYL